MGARTTTRVPNIASNARFIASPFVLAVTTAVDRVAVQVERDPVRADHDAVVGAQEHRKRDERRGGGVEAKLGWHPCPPYVAAQEVCACACEPTPGAQRAQGS